MSAKAEALREAIDRITSDSRTDARHVLRFLVETLGITRADVKGLRSHAKMLAASPGLTDAEWMRQKADALQTLLDASEEP